MGCAVKFRSPIRSTFVLFMSGPSIFLAMLIRCSLFRYKDDDQKCASVNLGAYGQNEKGQPQEGMLVGDACTGSYETCMAPGNVTIE